VAVTLGGGYALHLLNTVTVHLNTAKVAREVLGKVGWRSGCASGKASAECG